jgi:hypothetical protein
MLCVEAIEVNRPYLFFGATGRRVLPHLCFICGNL